MEYRKLGTTDVKITPIVFGAWAIGGTMWGGAEKKDAIQAIHKSLHHGISTIDTAPVYGFGRSEELVGEAIQGRRDKVEILTKYGLVWDGKGGVYHMSAQDAQGRTTDIFHLANRRSVIEECENSLRRLGTDYIDLYQIHWPDPGTPVEETMEALKSCLNRER